MSTTSSSDDDIREVKLIFANYEAAPKLQFSMPASSTIKDLKERLLSVWPREQVPLCEDLSRIRMICKYP